MEKQKEQKRTPRISKEEVKQGNLFSWWRPSEEDKCDVKPTPVQHLTKGRPFTIKL